MCSGSFQITWLKCSFHDFLPVLLTRWACFMQASKKAVHHTVFLCFFQVVFHLLFLFAFSNHPHGCFLPLIAV